MTTAREQAREAALSVPTRDESRNDTKVRAANAASDVWEPLTATARLRETGIDLARLNAVLESKDDWGHLVHAFEVLAVLGAVKQEMEAIGDG